MSAEIGVSKSAVYDKLNRLEPCVSQALVRYSALQMATLSHQMGGQLPAVLPKYRLKIRIGQWSGSDRASTGSLEKYPLWGFAWEIDSRA
jgi:hypothetical protein